MHAALNGLTVLERGWLSSNNIVIHAAGDEPGTVLVDSGHVAHADQTVALVRHALRGQRLQRIVNTHLHTDHCGGNAALQRAFGAPITVPPGNAGAVAAWDTLRLTHQSTGQRSERFVHAATLAPGEHFMAGGRRWDAIAAPGHDPFSLMLFDAREGVLISADALWEHGFGVVFPEIDGEPGFDDVGATLDAIERLPVRVVIPGHGAPFTDVKSALGRARSRLSGFQQDPARHARHAVKVLLKYHVMEERRIAHDVLLQWIGATPNLLSLWRRFGTAHSDSPVQWCDRFVDELVAQGALSRDGDDVVDR
ncbi:MAG: MBL fold metallo-hydrolase [Burkholderiaceae bacterium]|nr:MBL fold metallo-hydrolase [Burkholderiaceae bacterium]